MKNEYEQAIKSILSLMILCGGVVSAETVTDDDAKIIGNLTVEKRIYQYDGYGAQWALDTGSDGLWFVPKNDIGGIYDAPLKIRNDAAANTLVIGNNENGINGYVGIGTDAPKAQLDIKWDGSSARGDGLTKLMLLQANNFNPNKTSDAGFTLRNGRTGNRWNFRTTDEGDGFAATKEGTGGTEFKVLNTTANYHNAVVKMGGVTVFSGGHLVTASSRVLKTNIKPLDTQTALDAFYKLQPVSYEYKAHRGEAVVGFIAEDMPELVAMPSRKSFDSAEVVAVLTSVLAQTRAEMKTKDERIGAMEAKVSKLESLLTNQTLNTSDKGKSKVSTNLK